MNDKQNNKRIELFSKNDKLADLFSRLNTICNFIAYDTCIIRWEMDNDIKKLSDFKYQHKLDDCVDHLKDLLKVCKKIKKLDNSFLKYGYHLEED